MVKIKELQQYVVQLLAECFATCVHILIGEAAVANYKFTQEPSHSTLPIAIAFGVGVYSGNIDSNKQINQNSISIDHFSDTIIKSILFSKRALQCSIYCFSKIPR